MTSFVWKVMKYNVYVAKGLIVIGVLEAIHKILENNYVNDNTEKKKTKTIPRPIL